MYNSNMVICSIGIISILRRPKHIYCNCIRLEYFYIVTNKCRYSHLSFPSCHKREVS